MRQSSLEVALEVEEKWHTYERLFYAELCYSHSYIANYSYMNFNKINYTCTTAIYSMCITVIHLMVIEFDIRYRPNSEKSMYFVILNGLY